jgi:aspartyl-tRNA(Asn)/glutamyl-tRNA(Gln) amidotransferase subunit A
MVRGADVNPDRTRRASPQRHSRRHDEIVSHVAVPARGWLASLPAMHIEHLLLGRLTGRPLALAAHAVRQPRVAALGADVLRRELGISSLSQLMTQGESLEADGAPLSGRAPRSLAAIANAPEPPPWTITSEALTQLYRARSCTPEELLDRVLSGADRLAERQPWLRCLWVRDEVSARAAARAAGERYARGEQLGPLDGVPVLVKEQIAVAGLPRRLGHELPNELPMAHDATAVARLRAEGAVIVGLCAMTELGLSPLGINPKRPPLRNPHHVERSAGGSSTGAGIATSVGLLPLALAADSGGSIRTPASLCGVFGLKPSFGRISRHGDAVSGSLNHLGALGASCRDLAIFLDAVSGRDAADPLTLHAPKQRAPFAAALSRGVRGLRIGIDQREWSDAEPAVQRAGEQALRSLVQSGVELVDVSIALAPYAPAIGFVTIAAEVHALSASVFSQRREAFGHDVQVLLALAQQLEAREYLWAQALRARLRREVASIFQDVDALALPTTQRTAPSVSDADDRAGRLDATNVRALCRYAFFGNLTGLPCGTAPVGLDIEGLPIGLQIVGDAWDESVVLALLAELERLGVAHAARPPYHVDLLSEP